MPETRIERKEDHYLYLLHMPAVSEEKLDVEIKGNFLLIFHHLEFDGLNIPHLIQNVRIPVDVEITKIRAEIVDEILSVYLPFNELAGGYHKKVTIDRY